jgi:hypothetical protein
MGLYDGVNDAPTSTGGQYFKPGQYRMRVQSVTEITSRKNVPFFVVESVVVRTTCESYKPGSTISWLVNMNSDWALSNVKEFAQACGGDMSASVAGSDIEAMVSPEQPAIGVEVDVDAITRTSRAGNEWTQARWRPAGTLTEVADA